MQLPDELNSKRQDPEDEYKTKMYQLKINENWNCRKVIKDIFLEVKEINS